MTPAELLQADAAARRRALEVTGSFIVQAPAGSGKTELLVQRFLALLPAVERPEALLAITFTRKAAAEMRQRIVDALRGCDDPGSRLREETRQLARAAVAADELKQWGLRSNPSRLRVLTIDALNQSLARRLPVLSGLGAGLGVRDDARPLYEQAAERVLTHLPSADTRVAAAVAVLLEHLDNGVGRLIDLLAGMLARREAWLPVLPADLRAAGRDDRARQVLEAGRESLVTEHLAELVAAFPPSLLAELNRHAVESADVLRGSGIMESLLFGCGKQLPAGGVDSLAHWSGLAHFLLTDKGRPRKSHDARLGVLPADRKRPEIAQRKADIKAAVASLESAEHDSLCRLLHAARRLPPVAYDDAEWRVLDALLLVLRVAAGELKGVFAEEREADHAEFAAAARQALGDADAPTDTALALDATLRHVLVDEFQDTSAAQVRLLASLTAGWEPGDGRTLFLVGDPMQSIYRFRNAEVGLFLDLREHGLPNVRPEALTLRVNFRSTRPLVEWVNGCFARVLPPRDDVVRGAVRYSESVPAAEARDAGGVFVHAFLQPDRKAEARCVADIVERRLAAAPAEAAEASGSPPRVGILVQARSHLLDIVTELAARGIAFQATDIDPLGERPAVLDALALTRALSHLADRAAWLTVLRAPWCGLTLADCHVLLGANRHVAVPGALRDVATRAVLPPDARARLERCLPVLETAVDELSRMSLRDTVERAWHALGGPATLGSARELDEVEAFFAALGKAEAEAPGAAGVESQALSAALEGLYAPSVADADARVELLTIHKAKGLQFDTVIVPGLDRVGRSDAAQLLRWLERPERPDAPLVVAPVTEAGVTSVNPLYAWLDQLESSKLLHEKRRQLYVATTRAERELHLLGACGVVVDDAGNAALRKPADRSALGLLWSEPSIEGAFVRRLAEQGAPAPAPEQPQRRDPLLRRLPQDWSVPALPRGPASASREPARGEAGRSVEFDWATETARHVGTVVHGELQRLARGERLLPDAAAERAALLRRYRCELAELGVPDERRAAASLRVLEALERTLADPRGRWVLDAAHRDARSELALTGLYQRALVSVVIDRTFVDAAGVCWVVDFKTSAHEGAGLEEFLDSERERYRPQLEKYAALLRPLAAGPLRVGLYFPLLSQWREWEPSVAVTAAAAAGLD